MDYRQRFFVDPADKLRLQERDPGYRGDHETADSARRETEHYRVKLADLQAVLYAEGKHSLLVVLQALDADGKDGTVTAPSRTPPCPPRCSRGSPTTAPHGCWWRRSLPRRPRYSRPTSPARYSRIG